MKNLLIRTLSGAVFLALFLTALLWHPAAYGVLFMIAVFIIAALCCAVAYLFTCLAGYKVIKAAGPGNGAKMMLCAIGAVVSVVCLLLLLTPGSPALIGVAPRWVMVAWIVLGVIFYMTTKKEWSQIPEIELREQVLGSRDLPVFFKTK